MLYIPTCQVSIIWGNTRIGFTSDKVLDKVGRLYLLFINGLVRQIEKIGLGMCMNDMSVGWPTVADDMVVLSYSFNGRNAMLAICNEYANKWRYSYNSNKCSSIQRTPYINPLKAVYVW